MSYILDALKKAEAERERGQVPGLHAAASSRAPDEPFEGHRLPSWAWAALGALMTLVAALVWTLVERDPTPLPVSSPPATPVANSTQVAAATPAPYLSNTPAASDRLASQAHIVGPANVASPTPISRATTPPPGLRTQEGQDKPSAKPIKPLNEQRVQTLQELPDEVRQAIPALSFGGAMYSDQPASRMLLINGQAFHEGDRITDNLTLREIKLRSAVLVFKGHAYAVSY